MNNFMTFECNLIIPSDLSSNSILMIGRAHDKLKRFELGIQAMEYIIQEIPDSKMLIVSGLNGAYHLQNLVVNLNLENNIEFVGYISTPEIYFKNASLHIFPTITEAFSMVLCETKVYGIPTILLGLDYSSNIKGGTIIIYDDTSESLGKESIKLLKYKNMNIKLGKEARKSIKKYKNNQTLSKWIKLLLSIYNDNNYKTFINNKPQIEENEYINILKKQIKLLKLRDESFKNININNFLNYSFIEK